VAVIVTRSQPVELGVMRLAGETLEENLQLPAAKDRLRQSRHAAWGLGLLALGFALQLVATWP
jgi:hypothetical protein